MTEFSAPPSVPEAARPRSFAERCGLNKTNLLLFAAVALLLVYGSVRQRYIWGVDSFGYYQLGKLFSEGRIFLPLPFETSTPAALAPWGFEFNALRQGVPGYPPGFSLLLAIGHWLGAPLWVTPACGVISCFVLFRLLRLRVSEGTAALFTAAWAVMPLTVYGSTMLMSDLVAATTIMGGLLAFRENRPILAAWIFGLGVAVRPTNVLFFAPFALLLRFDRASIRFVLHLAVPGALYGLYNFLLHGAPWRTGYSHVWDTLSAKAFPAFFAFFCTAIWQLLTALLLGFVGFALLRPNRERIFLVLWLAVFVVFYSFWSAGGVDRWWWARFILPGLPALFLLAADGFEILRDWGTARGFRPVWWKPLVTLPVLALPLVYLQFGFSQNDLWLRTVGKPNYDLVQQVRKIAPPGSLIGSLEHASTCYLYSDLVPFVCVDRGALPLVEEALAQGRRVFLLPEPWNASQPVVLELMQRYHAREVARYDSPWPNLILFELQRR